MKRTAAIAASLAAVLVSTRALAAEQRTKFTELADAAEFSPAFTPWALTSGTTTVVLVLSGESVAEVQARSALKLDRAAHESIERQLGTEQAAVERGVRARGGQVVGRFQNALNGLKVRVAWKDLPAVAALPGVVAVRPVMQVRPDNVVGVPLIGATEAWAGVPGVRGEGVKIAIIDTGLDYTHANFGGPGTPEAYAAAFAAGTLPADPALFGPTAPKVKGGIDLAGDDYDASSDDPALTVPKPDANPLDCNGHGSHVGGSAAGFGVTSAGATYAGPYTPAAFGATRWRIGPGVAPKASLYAVRVFGCSGSTDLTVDAIDWAVKNGMDVINMSLGSSFGAADDATSLAAENAAKAGLLVVASAGNSGPSPYITGAPGAGNRVISVAAIDPAASFPSAALALSSGATVTAIDANGAPLPAGPLDLFVLRNADGSVSLGCSEAEYQANAAAIAGKVVVSLRGVCARVDRAILGQKYGAAAALMINNAVAFPPFEGEIPGVTIPFLGIRSGDAAAVLGAASITSFTAGAIANPDYARAASFSSGGPRTGDSKLKPTLAAPGVSTLSTAVGTGDQGERISGTSMASPHVAGVAALVKQAHPGWRPEELRAAVASTANPAKLNGYVARLLGGGLVQALEAVRTQAVAIAQPGGALNLSFGFEEIEKGSARAEDKVKVRNRGRTPVIFDVAAAATTATPHALDVRPSRIVVRAGGEASVEVRLTVPGATAGNADAFRDVAGLVTFTPAAGTNGGVALQVPYYLVPRARSGVEAHVSRPFGPAVASVDLRARNERAAIDGTVDVYALGPQGLPNANGSIDVRAAGVQSFPDGAGGAILVFAVNVFNRFSNAAVNEYDVLVDVDADGVADFAVVGIDFGLLTTGSFDGRVASAVINLRTGAARVRFLATAPTDGATLLLPARASDLGIVAANPRFTYAVEAFSFEVGTADATATTGSYNAFTPAVETGGFATVPVGGAVTFPVAIDAAEWAVTPPAGLMVVTLDDKAGPKQADLIRADP